MCILDVCFSTGVSLRHWVVFFVILCILGVVPSSVFSNSAKKKEDSSLKRAVMCRVTKASSVKHGLGG